MKENSIYSKATGVVVSYKNQCENLIFNELNKEIQGIKLLDRSNGSAVFELADYQELVDKAHDNRFIFMQHIHPYMQMENITGNQSDMSVFLNMAEQMLDCLNSENTYICQCRIATDKEFEYSNADITNAISDFYKSKEIKIAVDNADSAISITVFDEKAYIGVSRLSDNVSEWCGGILFYSKSEDTICRAEFKLEEAFHYFKIAMESGSTALDLGAAPGGWSAFLAKQGIMVDAVDPANLDERVTANPNVKHYKMTAQEHIRKNPDKMYDIIVNDMKMDTNQSIDIFCEVSSQLKTGGIGIITLKLPKEKVTKRIQVAANILGRHFTTVVFKQLYYNRSEVTAYVVK